TFFFQAEDGIRDFHVTGVQTCALPISPACQTWSANVAAGVRPAADDGMNGKPIHWDSMVSTPPTSPGFSSGYSWPPWQLDPSTQIGRASCRERVEDAMGARTGNNQEHA